MWKFYTSPDVQVHSSLEDYRCTKIAEVVDGREDLKINCAVLTMMWMLNISASSMISLSSINYSDGRISQHLEGNLKNFVTSCFKGKRECTFASLFNWVLQSRRSCKDLDWKRTNPNKLTRELWNTLPKALKNGAKESMGSIVYSTK